MRVGQAKELFRALTQQYFGGANVVFANQSRTAKQKVPLVVLTPGNVHRPQAPNYTFVDGEVVGHYLSRFSITVDLFTNGSPVVDEVSGKTVAYEDNAVDDMPNAPRTFLRGLTLNSYQGGKTKWQMCF